MNIFSLFKKRPEQAGRRRYGECQRCKRTDYLPWATEDGEFYCGWCHEKDALDYARMRGWRPPEPPGLDEDGMCNDHGVFGCPRCVGAPSVIGDQESST